jgi:hypothetical protein
MTTVNGESVLEQVGFAWDGATFCEKMESRDFIRLTRKILDGEFGIRERAADEVTDLLRAYRLLRFRR